MGQKECIYIVNGTLTNNGTISMTARGAKAEGQNVYLFKNIEGNFEYVPAVGGAVGRGGICYFDNSNHIYGGGGAGNLGGSVWSR